MSEGKWLSITDYSSYKKVSVSSIRRYIKANRVQFKKEDGKYWIWVKAFDPQLMGKKEQDFSQLQKKINELEEENQELRMLVELYEKKLFNQGLKPKHETLPEIPFN
ncbi:MAG: hypothetical protein H6621_06885 [Halobacteriovoraceae bacterium]|nr:hypothetical protein [Halobacteriovoraceae bacterium]